MKHVHNRLGMRTRGHIRRLLIGWLLLSMSEVRATLAAGPGPTLFTMDAVEHHPAEFTRNKQKIIAGTAELVPGKFGKAVKFSFVEGASGGFMIGRVRADATWNRSAGFSFWVKGDGSQNFGGIELIDRDDYSLRYACCFPIDSTEWRKIFIPWRDVIPELAGPLIDPESGYAPEHFGSFNFGKWFYWRNYPAESFAIDQVSLEQTIPEQRATENNELAFARLRQKLAAHQPITIVTMGDSLTDQRHWSNQKIVWHSLLADALKQKHGSAVKVVNPAIGGTTLSQNLILMPRWAVDAPSPDLVTVWFGGNDWNSGVRGERFKQYLRLAVDRIGRQTNGAAAILLMTTCPSHENWVSMKELEQAATEVAKEKHVGLADVAAAFRKAGSADEALKNDYWAWDKTHLGNKGHEIARDVVLYAMEKQ